MRSFFDPVLGSDRFAAFSAAHVAALAALLLLGVLLYRYRAAIRGRAPLRAAVRFGLVAALAVPQAALFRWYAAEGLWDVRYTLPLELCSITQLLAIAMLAARSRLLYGIVYLAGIGGALQAMLTPDLVYPFPHFRFFHFFVVHMAIILAPLYMTWIEGFRPAWKDIGVAMVFLNVLVVTVGPLDYWLDANYMFLRRKPEAASLLSVLGPYPYYLIAEEAIALAIFVLLLLPFLRRGSKP
ncbi:TIGR02206 family membrane protein [Paenibacillus sp. GCM10023250]|uniref:YwaF family protein n=1 Tax=Paenibacillus sp. GCM10023250 TaxID=3252648 RepID=UPI00360B2BA5